MYVVGEQNLPAPNFSLACELFKKKKKKDQGPKDSGGNSDLVHNCLKEFLQRAYSWNRASTRDILKEHDLGAWVNSRYYLVSKLCPTLLLPP